MSFPINICSHNENDVLSGKMVFYHVIITHLHWQPFTGFQLSAQSRQCDFQYLNNELETREKKTFNSFTET